MKKIIHKNTTWLQITNPHAEDLTGLRKEFGFHTITVNDLKRPSIRAKVERYKDYLYMAIHFPIFVPEERMVLPGEIDFLITKKTLITIHYEKSPALDEFEEKLLKTPEIKDDYFKNPIRLLYYLLDENFNYSLRQLDHIKLNIDQAQHEIYKGEELKMVKEISYILRDILSFKRIVKFNDDILRSLEKEVVGLFGDKYQPYLESLIGKVQEVNSVVESHLESINILRDTNQAMLSTKTNEIMKLLGIIAFLTFPLSIIANLARNGLNFSDFDSIMGPLILISLFIVCSLLVFFYFKGKKWL